MYSIIHSIQRLSNFINKDDIQYLFKQLSKNDIIYVCKYLDSIIYSLNNTNIGYISIDIFNDKLLYHKRLYEKIYNNNDEKYLTIEYDKYAIKKILYWMETFNYIDKEGIFQKDWISKTHFSNYPKVWLTTMYVFNIIKKYKNCSLDYLLHYRQKNIDFKKLLSKNRFLNNRYIFIEVCKDYDAYYRESYKILDEILFFIGKHDIQIIYNIEIFNVGDYQNEINIEIKRRCLLKYLNIFTYILDNIIYEKGYNINQDRDLEIIYMNIYLFIKNNIYTIIFLCISIVIIYVYKCIYI
jgi:hypothetical protein